MRVQSMKSVDQWFALGYFIAAFIVYSFHFNENQFDTHNCHRCIFVSEQFNLKAQEAMLVAETKESNFTFHSEFRLEK